jgi:hypothetical protein
MFRLACFCPLFSRSGTWGYPPTGNADLLEAQRLQSKVNLDTIQRICWMHRSCAEIPLGMKMGLRRGRCIRSIPFLGAEVGAGGLFPATMFRPNSGKARPSKGKRSHLLRIRGVPNG